MGIELHRSLVGEYVTSLEMAGLSLTVTAVDAELRRLVDAPARPLCAPSLGSGCVVTAAQARAAFEDVARAIEEHQAELDRLDAVAGDGDHGATMVMGLRGRDGALPGGDEPGRRAAADRRGQVRASVGG